MNNNFQRALQFVLKWEGGYSKDANDPGGETKWGISKRSHPTLDIRNLTPEQAASIYETEYWNTAGCGEIPFPECVAVFDTAVNNGPLTAKAWWRNSANVEEFIQKRVDKYVGIVDNNPGQKKYLSGWLNRINDLKKYLVINANDL